MSTKKKWGLVPYIMFSTVLALTSLLPWVDVDDVDKVVVADVDDACDVDEVDVYHLAD